MDFLHRFVNCYKLDVRDCHRRLKKGKKMSSLIVELNLPKGLVKSSTFPSRNSKAKLKN